MSAALEGSETITCCPVCFDVNTIVTTVIRPDGDVEGHTDIACGFCGRHTGDPPATPFVMDYFNDNTMQRRG